MIKPDLSVLKNPKVAIPVVIVGVGLGYLIVRRSGSTSATAATAAAQSPVEDPLAAGSLPGTGGGMPLPGSTGGGDTGGTGSGDVNTPVDNGDTINDPTLTISPVQSAGYVRSVSPLPPPATAVVGHPTVPVVGAVPLHPGDTVPNVVPPGSSYGTAGYFNNGNAQGFSDAEIAEGGNVMVALGAPQANANIPVVDAAQNPRTVLQEALSPSPGVVNAGNGVAQVAPGSTSDAQLAAMLKSATPAQLASPEWRKTFNDLQAETGGTARL